MTQPAVEKPTSKSAKILYKPWGIAGSFIAAFLAQKIFHTVWVKAVPLDTEDPPKPLESEYGWKQIIIAAAIQGMIFTTVKAVFQRVTARGFERWSGEWPGD
jgi:hypothetical protein